MKKTEILEPIKELSKSVDIKLVNELLSQTDLKDFEMNKSTITNIAEWCLNGDSDTEIRKKLSLTPKQWSLLVAICPTLLIVMKDTRALADVVVAGSLFQTAIGGKKITKTVPVKVHEYEVRGGRSVVVGEHYVTMEVQEELPPNPLLLKFLAEHKMSEKLGDVNINKGNGYKEIIDSLSPEDRAMVLAMKKASELNGGK